MENFCTYFDHRYLAQGLALYQSLKDHSFPFQLWVLCLDDECHQALLSLGLKGMQLIRLKEFEEQDEELLKAKQNRSPVEYYFTCTPSLPLFIFKHFPQVQRVTYLDADLFFFSNPAPLFEAMDGGSIALIEHRSRNKKFLERYGTYNIGWLSFRRDERALGCLQEWRRQCLEWCYDRIEPGRFADQKYLDDWPTRYEGVVVLGHKGANLAPWNVSRYRIHSKGGAVRVDEVPLIFFHFHILKGFLGWICSWGRSGILKRPSKEIRQLIYAPYLEILKRTGSPTLNSLRNAVVSSYLWSFVPNFFNLAVVRANAKKFSKVRARINREFDSRLRGGK